MLRKSIIHSFHQTIEENHDSSICLCNHSITNQFIKQKGIDKEKVRMQVYPGTSNTFVEKKLNRKRKKEKTRTMLRRECRAHFKKIMPN